MFCRLRCLALHNPDFTTDDDSWDNSSAEYEQRSHLGSLSRSASSEKCELLDNLHVKFNLSKMRYDFRACFFCFCYFCKGQQPKADVLKMISFLQMSKITLHILGYVVQSIFKQNQNTLWNSSWNLVNIYGSLLLRATCLRSLTKYYIREKYVFMPFFKFFVFICKYTTRSSTMGFAAWIHFCFCSL